VALGNKSVSLRIDRARCGPHYLKAVSAVDKQTLFVLDLIHLKTRDHLAIASRISPIVIELAEDKIQVSSIVSDIATH
jgi:hypothetical protein